MKELYISIEDFKSLGFDDYIEYYMNDKGVKINKVFGTLSKYTIKFGNRFIQGNIRNKQELIKILKDLNI